MSSPRVERVVAALVGETEQAMKVLTVELTAELATGTPFDTGWARANWIPLMGGEGREGAISPSVGVSVAAQEIAVARVVTSYRVAAGPVYVSNHVPYIRALEEGWSAQAPTGFVRQSIVAAMAKARAVLRGA